MHSTDCEDSTPLISVHGIPTTASDTRRPFEKYLAVYLILISTLLERIAFYSLAANLVLSLDSNVVLYWKEANASIATLIFTGTSYFSTLLFAIISDAKFGRGKTILIGFCIYLSGYTMATVVSNSNKDICKTNASTEDDNLDGNTIFVEPCANWILATIIIIGIGAGATQSNMAVFGAEQLQKLNIKSRYFDKYVVVLNLAAITSKLIIPKMQNNPNHFYIGYLVVTIILFFAALIFILGWRFYLHTNLNETVVVNCIPVIVNAFQTWLKYRKLKKPKTNSSLTSSINNYSNLIEVEEEENSTQTMRRPSVFIDFAKAINQGKYHDRIVDDVKSLRKAFFVYGLLIPYWLIYNQLDSTFLTQRQHMQVPVSMNGSALFLSSISFGDPITIIIGIIILNLFVYKYMETHNRSINITTKFVIGMIVATITMCTAGGIEMLRQSSCKNTSETSELPIYYQLPQNILLGFSELFLMIASFEFAYYASPRSAQTLFMSLRFCSIGISSFIGSLCIYIFPRTYVDLNFTCNKHEEWNWSFYTYFFILAGFQLIFKGIFIICQTKFHIIRLNRQQIQTNQFAHFSSSLNKKNSISKISN